MHPNVGDRRRCATSTRSSQIAGHNKANNRRRTIARYRLASVADSHGWKSTFPTCQSFRSLSYCVPLDLSLYSSRPLSQSISTIIPISLSQIWPNILTRIDLCRLPITFSVMNLLLDRYLILCSPTRPHGIETFARREKDDTYHAFREST